MAFKLPRQKRLVVAPNVKIIKKDLLARHYWESCKQLDMIWQCSLAAQNPPVPWAAPKAAAWPAGQGRESCPSTLSL